MTSEQIAMRADLLEGRRRNVMTRGRVMNRAKFSTRTGLAGNLGTL